MEQSWTSGSGAISIREFSRNPSKVLRDASESPVLVCRHQRPIAYVVSIEQWMEMASKIKDTELRTVLTGLQGWADDCPVVPIGAPVIADLLPART